MLPLSKKIKNLILLSIVPFFSLINSILQAQYEYDGFHWGLVLYTADSLNLGLLPYKEVFVHYGILTSKINAIILKIFSNNFLYSLLYRQFYTPFQSIFKVY